MPPATRRSSFATRRCSRTPHPGDRLARAAPPGRRLRRGARRDWASGRAIASPRSCPTCRRRRSRFSPCASLGAIWSVCSPDMGPLAVLDRFRQIEPKVLVACDGYRYGGVAHDRTALLRDVVAELPSVRDVVFWRDLDARPMAPRWRRRARRVHDFDALVAGERTIAPRLAAVRASALDRLLERHDRPAEGDRPRPRRHHARGAQVRHAAQRLRAERRSAATATTGTARPAGSCGTRRCRRLLGGATICIYDGSPAGPKAVSRRPADRLDDALALRRGDAERRSSAPARRSTRAA